MKFLVDNMLSVKLVEELSAFGHEAVHVRALGLARASDSQLLDLAKAQNRIVLSADRDFGTLLAELRVSQPSVVYLRGGIERSPKRLAATLSENLARIESLLAEGVIVVIEPGRVRIRRLPIL